MNDEPFLKCPCQHCGDTIEFPAQGIGLTVECPHCAQRTILNRPAVLEPTTTPASADAEAAAPEAPAESAEPAMAADPAGFTTLRRVAVFVGVVLLAGAAFWYFRPGSPRKETVLAAKPATNPPAAVPVVDTNPPPNPPPTNDGPGVAAVAASDKSIEDLKPGPVTFEKAKSGSLVYAVGTLKNDSAHQRFGVKVELEFEDAKGRPAGAATDYTQIIEPHQEWRFRALVLDGKAVSGKVTGVKEDN